MEQELLFKAVDGYFISPRYARVTWRWQHPESGRMMNSSWAGAGRTGKER